MKEEDLPRQTPRSWYHGAFTGIACGRLLLISWLKPMGETL